MKFDLEISTVQDLSNDIENKINNVVDKIAPISRFSNNRLEESTLHPEWLKRKIYNISNYKVGRNLLCNRFKQLNNKIDYSWFNESLDTFKVKCKKLLLQTI